MQYRVVLIESEYGIAAKCPDLDGVFSEGKTRDEALDNIKIAIREWLDAEEDERRLFKIHEEVVNV